MADNDELLWALLQEAQHFHDRTPALREFAPWPNNLTLAGAEPHGFPALDLIRNWQGARHFIARSGAPSIPLTGARPIARPR
jgi:hypothetical protein